MYTMYSNFGFLALFTKEITMLYIDRTRPFNPSYFLGEGCSIKKEDERSLKICKLDPNKISLITTCKNSERSISGEENTVRLITSGAILLDALVFKTLWKNRHLVQEIWVPMLGIEYIHFNGTTFQDANGFEYNLHMCVRTGKLRYGFSCSNHRCDSDTLSAVLEN